MLLVINYQKIGGGAMVLGLVTCSRFSALHVPSKRPHLDGLGELQHSLVRHVVHVILVEETRAGSSARESRCQSKRVGGGSRLLSGRQFGCQRQG